MPLSEKGQIFLREYLKVAPRATDEYIDQFVHDMRTENVLKYAIQNAWSKFLVEKERHPSRVQGPVAPIAQRPQLNSVNAPLTTPPRTSLSAPPAPAASLPKPLTPPSPSLNPLMPPMSTKSLPTLAFRLANAKAGVDYRCKLELVTPDAPAFEIKAIEVPPDLGLIGDGMRSEVFGKPNKDGDFKFKVWYSIGDSDLAQSTTVVLVINPDPKSLWKDLPSNQSDPYWKPDLASVSLEGDAVHMVAASKRGRSHAHVGSFRDDDFYLSYLPEDRWHIAIVSDGAGSAKFSRRGSQIICNEGGARLQELLVGADGAKLIQAVEAWNEAKVNGSPSESLERQVQNLLYTTVGYTAHHVTRLLQDECKTRADLGGVFKDYSSTAIIGLMRKFPFGVLCATYWVGDGAVGVLKTDGTATLLGESDSGEYSGQTRFLEPAEVSQDALMKRIRFELTAEFKAMILMTDGVSDPFFETEANLTNPAKWTALWEDVSSKASLAQADQEVAQRVVDWLDFWSSGNHDDRTLAVLY
jgi:hypothetical protein